MQKLKSKSQKGLIFIISAPSGTGKTTIRSHLLRRNPRLAFSVSYTTRRPRRGEKSGVDYRFISRAEFQKRVRQRQFLEWAEVHGELYGTGRKDLERLRKSGQDALVEVDCQGQKEIQKILPETVSIFILPESRAELERRLRKRGTETSRDLSRRLKQAELELSRAKYYDYVVVNRKVDRAVREIEAIITAEHCRPR